ncbi:MAG: hypothetical protein GY943_06605 [Chloroflexi bacterium]|nr:hypothetical protein [Chloroflexota bacterium]
MNEQPRYVTGSEWARITAKAWVDPAFREALERNPLETIRHDPDVGVQFDRLLSLPDQPSAITEEKLKKVASGEEAAIVIPYTCITICMI